MASPVRLKFVARFTKRFHAQACLAYFRPKQPSVNFSRIGNGDAKTCFARVGQNDVIPGTPSLKSKAFEHASDALARIERKVFDTPLGADQFNFWRLDANGTLILPARVGFRRVVLLH